MLHDIGTTPTNMPRTRLSFELWGALHALTLLPTLGAPPDQAELVAEVISRHQDLGDVGSVPAVLALVYVGTLLDNVGLCAEFVSADTVGAVTGAWPRLKWSGCFAGTVRKELGLKPWAHSSVIDGFAEAVEGNRVMEAYE
jgi:cyanamide hydratase